MIAIIDYDAGNIKSVEKAFEFLSQETITTRNPEIILKADKVVLPGVGSFGDAMNKLHEYDTYVVVTKSCIRVALCAINEDEARKLPQIIMNAINNLEE